MISTPFVYNPIGYEGDGTSVRGPHSKVKIDAEWVTVDALGNIYFGSRENFGSVIRRIDKDGIINTILEDLLDPIPYSAQDRSLYVASAGALFKLEAALPAFGPDDVIVPREDGERIDVFDFEGRHLEVRDARTSLVLKSFSYDGNGQLASVSDRFGNVTAIHRNSAGQVTAIESPFGQTTTLNYDGNGLLQNVTYPDNGQYQMEYVDGEGLLSSFQRPGAGAASSFEYDALGRLTFDQRPDGSFIALERNQGRGGYEVRVTDSAGRDEQYGVWGAPTGALLRSSTSTTGLVAESVRDKNESSIRVLRNGTSVETTFGEDPRLGMLSPVPERVVVTTPGGLSRVSGQTRDVSLDPMGRVEQMQLPGARVVSFAYDVEVCDYH